MGDGPPAALSVLAPAILLSLPVLLSLAAPSAAFAEPAVQTVCTPSDPDLDELSGLASDGRHWFAMSDGGASLQVAVLDPADCSTVDTITADVNPYDVEDLALAGDGALWLADTGDNDRQRGTVALHRLTRDGSATLYRLTYPDGPHDAEALLMDRSGVPYLVTKDLVGESGVYRPSGPLAAPGPTPLEKAGTIRIERTATRGGPAGSFGSLLITGGSVSPDGRVVALRTYTDAYLFAAPDADIPTALAGEPVRIPLPDEPAGEAVALAPDGTLLSGSEGGAPIRAVPGAVGLVREVPAAQAAPAAPPVAGAPTSGAVQAQRAGAEDGQVKWKAAVVAGGLVCLLLALVVRRGQRAR